MRNSTALVWRVRRVCEREREIHTRVASTDARIVGIRGNAVVGLERNILIATMALGAFKCKLTELN